MVVPTQKNSPNSKRKYQNIFKGNYFQHILTKFVEYLFGKSGIVSFYDGDQRA